jgi:uncharacterized membrane protein YkoI
VSALSRALLAALAAVSLGMAGAGTAQSFERTRSGTEPGAALAPGEALTDAAIAQLPNRRELTLAEAIVSAQSRYPGRVVRAQTIQQGNGAVHEVRIIGNDGLVHTVRVDARTGAVQ